MTWLKRKQTKRKSKFMRSIMIIRNDVVLFVCFFILILHHLSLAGSTNVEYIQLTMLSLLSISSCFQGSFSRSDLSFSVFSGKPFFTRNGFICLFYTSPFSLFVELFRWTLLKNFLTRYSFKNGSEKSSFLWKIFSFPSLSSKVYSAKQSNSSFKN